MVSIITKFSANTGVVPTANDLSVGELALNTADSKIWTKHTDNSIRELGGAGTVPISRQVIAGDGLTGGGDLSTDRTFDVVGNTGITANSTGVFTNDSAIIHNNLSGFNANDHIDHSTVIFTAGDGLTGGGTLVSSRTFDILANTGIVANSTGVFLGSHTHTVSEVTDFDPTNYFNLSDNETVTGNTIFAADVTITGNLETQGTLTFIDSTTFDVGTEFINLNTDHSGAPSLDAGIVINRGTSANAIFQWNEAADQWEIDGLQIATGSPTSDFLPLTGGTLTGDFIISQNQTNLMRTIIENIASSGNRQTDLQIGFGTASHDVFLGINFGGDNNSFIDNRSTGPFEIRHSGVVKFSQNSAGAATFFTEGIKIEGVAPIITYEATNVASGVRYDVIGQTSGQAFRWLEDNNELMRLDINGDLTVGKILFDVSASRLIIGDGTDGGAGLRINNSSAGSPFIQFEQNGSVKGSMVYQDTGDTIDIISDGNIDIFPSNGSGHSFQTNRLRIRAAISQNAEIFFDVNGIAKYRIGVFGAVNNFRLRDETNGVDRLLINQAGTVTIPGTTKLEGYAWVRGSVAMASTGALLIKMGLLTGSFVSSTDCFVGVHDTGGPGASSGDLILASRNNRAGANSIRFFSGKDGVSTERLTVSDSGIAIAGNLDFDTVSGAGVATIAETETGTLSDHVVTPVGIDATRESLKGEIIASASRVGVATDAGKIIRFTGSGAKNYTVNDSVFEDHNVITVLQEGTGIITINGTATLQNRNGKRTAGQWAMVSITILDEGATTVAVVAGDTIV